MTAPAEKKRSHEEVLNSSSEDSIHVTVSKEELQEMIDKAITKAMEKEREQIKDMVHEFKENVAMLIEDVNSMKTDIVGIKEEMAEVNVMKQRINSLEQSLSCQINDVDNYQRRENLRIHGLKERNGEDPVKVVQEFFAENNYTVGDGDLHIVHRVGKASPHKPRAMIVRFHNRNTKMKIIRDRKKLKGSGITLAEDVSTLTMQTLIRIQKNELIASAWTWNGVIWATHTKDPKKKPFSVKPLQTVEDAWNNRKQ